MEWQTLGVEPVLTPDEMAAVDAAGEGEALPSFTHVLTHRDLHLHPVLLRGSAAAAGAHCALRCGLSARRVCRASGWKMVSMWLAWRQSLMKFRCFCWELTGMAACAR